MTTLLADLETTVEINPETTFKADHETIVDTEQETIKTMVNADQEMVVNLKPSESRFVYMLLCFLSVKWYFL